MILPPVAGGGGLGGCFSRISNRPSGKGGSLTRYLSLVYRKHNVFIPMDRFDVWRERLPLLYGGFDPTEATASG